MAIRRMITKKLTSSMQFINMSASAQALYLHLVAESDDDGIAEGKLIMRMAGRRKRDLEELIQNGFITLLEPSNDIVWVTNWQSFNTVKNDRGIPSRYRQTLIGQFPDMKNTLFKPKNGDFWKQNGSTDKNRIGKSRIGKSREKVSSDDDNNDQYTLDFIKQYAASKGYDTQLFKPELFFNKYAPDWKTSHGNQIEDVGQMIETWINRIADNEPEKYDAWRNRMSAAMVDSKNQEIISDDDLKELLCKGVPAVFQEVWRGYNASHIENRILLPQDHFHGYVNGKEPVIFFDNTVFFKNGHTEDLSDYKVDSVPAENTEKYILVDSETMLDIWCIDDETANSR